MRSLCLFFVLFYGTALYVMFLNAFHFLERETKYYFIPIKKSQSFDYFLIVVNIWQNNDPTSIAWYCPIINSKEISKVVKLFNAGRFLFYFMLENMAFVYCLNFWVKYKWRIALFGGKNIVKLIHVCLLLTASQKIQAPFFHFHQGRRSKMTIGTMPTGW